MRKFTVLLIMLALMPTMAIMNACSDTKFNSSKDSTLQNNNVFGGDDAGGVVNQPPTDDSGGQINQPPGTTPPPTPTPNPNPDPGYFVKPGQTSKKTFLLCSTFRDQAVTRTTFKRAYAENRPLQLIVNNKLCTSNKEVLYNLVLKDTLSIADLKAICPAVVPASGEIKPELFVDSKALYYTQDGHNYNTEFQVLWAGFNNAVGPDVADANCDFKGSPLVIHLSKRDHPQAIALTDKANGVNFDLLGSSNNYKPVRVSWFSNDEYRMLALPKNKVVEGIDQVFGDNTKGPDGKRANEDGNKDNHNGYFALAKYDDNKDGRIDAKDEVFNKLALWHDANRNGRGEEHELKGLSNFGIKYIDLDFERCSGKEDKDRKCFKERDQWGNETLMKSVIGYEDGSLDLIFDLWFSYRLNYVR